MTDDVEMRGQQHVEYDGESSVHIADEIVKDHDSRKGVMTHTNAMSREPPSELFEVKRSIENKHYQLTIRSQNLACFCFGMKRLKKDGSTDTKNYWTVARQQVVVQGRSDSYSLHTYLSKQGPKQR